VIAATPIDQFLWSARLESVVVLTARAAQVEGAARRTSWQPRSASCRRLLLHGVERCARHTIRSDDRNFLDDPPVLLDDVAKVKLRGR